MIRVAGGGPGSIKYLTLDVYDAIKNAKKVVAFGRIGESLSEIREDIIKINRVADLLYYTKEEEDLLIIASGDPLFYGVTNFLKKNKVEIKEVLPGLSSFQYFMTRLQKHWQEAFLFSVHGREFNIENLLNKPLSVGLVDQKHSPSWLSKELHKKGAKGKIFVGSNLSYEHEEILEGKIGEVFQKDESLSVVVVEIEMD